jgi:hypothetical protein
MINSGAYISCWFHPSVRSNACWAAMRSAPASAQPKALDLKLNNRDPRKGDYGCCDLTLQSEAEVDSDIYYAFRCFTFG